MNSDATGFHEDDEPAPGATPFRLIHSPSENYSSRQGHDAVATIIHYTADGVGWNPVAWMRDPSSGVSAHFCIERCGRTHKLVDLTHAAWHAGRGEVWYKARVHRNPNLCTIGIELANAGLLEYERGKLHWQLGRGQRREFKGSAHYAVHGDAEGFWEVYPEAQLSALERLLDKFRTWGYGEAADRLLGHDEIAKPQGRKIDPGPMFPWSRFRSE